MAASFYPLAHFAEQVGVEHVRVEHIMPAGAEPHEYEPSPRDIRRVWEARVFVFHGAGLDPWAEKLHRELAEKGTLTVHMTEHFDLLPARGTNHDPHIWLDPLMAVKMVEVIRDALIQADPRHGDAYRRNGDDYAAGLSELHRKFEEGLRSCRLRDIIVTHDAFRYLARRYGLKSRSLAGVSPEEEPSPRKMADIVRFARQKGIRYIFYETLAGPRLAETIAREVDGETLPLNPVGGLSKEELRAGKTYISLMEENLRNLRLAMSCR